MQKIGKIFGYVTAVLVGVFPAFYLVFVALYADGSLNDKLSILYLVIPVYLILGFFFGWLVKPNWWKGTLALSAAAIVKEEKHTGCIGSTSIQNGIGDYTIAGA